MSLPVRNVRFGFGFYLSVSAVVHAVAFLFISFAPVERTQATPEEVVPTKIQFQQPASDVRMAGSTDNFMSMDSSLSTGDGNRQVREATGLPSRMRRAPAPNAYVKSNMTRYAELPSPSEISTDFQAPKTMELSDNIRTIDVSLGEMETIGRIPTIGVSDTGTEGELLGLGQGDVEEKTRRSLVERSSFPYSKARSHLPDRRMSIEFELLIEPDGSVNTATVSRSSGNERLVSVLREWLMNWQYESGEQRVRQSVTIQIPGA